METRGELRAKFAFSIALKGRHKGVAANREMGSCSKKRDIIEKQEELIADNRKECGNTALGSLW